MTGYEVLSHAETPGLGAKMGDWFRDSRGHRSVIGRDPQAGNFRVVKDPGGEIDGITAGHNHLACIPRSHPPGFGRLRHLHRIVMNSKLRILYNGIVAENPTFVLMLGMCPTLGTTGSALTGMSMGLATTGVLICSNMAISAIKGFIPSKVRIPAYIVVIATFVTILQMLMQAYLPALNELLGIFIPLIVVNCILLGRAEAYASRHGILDSCLDGIGIGAGFTLALTLLGAVRELLGSGRIFGATLFPEEFGALIFILAPGAFIVLGLLIALFNHLKNR